VGKQCLLLSNLAYFGFIIEEAARHAK